MSAATVVVIAAALAFLGLATVLPWWLSRRTTAPIEPDERFTRLLDALAASTQPDERHSAAPRTGHGSRPDSGPESVDEAALCATHRTMQPPRECRDTEELFDAVFSEHDRAELDAAFQAVAASRDAELRWRTTEEVSALARRRTRLEAARPVPGPGQGPAVALEFQGGACVVLERPQRHERLATAMYAGSVRLVGLRCAPDRWELCFDTAVGLVAVRCRRLALHD